MDQNTDTNSGAPMTGEKNPMSSIISILIIVIILAFGAFYFLKQVSVPAENAVLTPVEKQADPTISALSAQSTSTDLNAIQKDLNTTDLSGVDAGLNNISI